jgi:hypothetical protein
LASSDLRAFQEKKVRKEIKAMRGLQVFGRFKLMER